MPFWISVCLLLTSCWFANNAIGSKRTNCCLRGATICQCETMNIIPYDVGCPVRIAKTVFRETSTKDIYLTNKTLAPGLYSVVAFDVDRLPNPAHIELAWVVFLAVNVEDSCLTGPQPCIVHPIIQSTFAPCKHMFDHETRINLFLIKQTQMLTADQFIASGTVLARYQLSPAPHLMEFSRFRDRQMYEGIPVRAMQYHVVRCSRLANLMSVSQRLEENLGFMEMESYLYSPSPGFPVRPKIQALFPAAYVTKLMVYRGSNDCSLLREFHLARFEYYTNPVWHETYCPIADILNEASNLLDKIGMEEFTAHMSKRIAFWALQIRNEYRHYMRILELSEQVEAVMAASQVVPANRNGSVNRAVEQNVTISALTEAGEFGEDDVATRQTTEAKRAQKARALAQEDQDEQSENQFQPTQLQDEQETLYVHRAYAKPLKRVLYRATWAMVRLQILTNMYELTVNDRKN